MTAGPDDSAPPIAGAAEPEDEATVVSRRGIADGGLDDTVRSASATEAPPGPRRTPVDDPEPTEATDDGSTHGGSTVVARRESRRRLRRAHPGQNRGEQPEVEVPASGVRIARAPDSTPPPTPVRSPAPVVVARAAPVARAPQDVVDTAAVEESGRRRSRRIAAAVVVTASALAAGASAALVVLLTMG